MASSEGAWCGPTDRQTHLLSCRSLRQVAERHRWPCAVASAAPQRLVDIQRKVYLRFDQRVCGSTARFWSARLSSVPLKNRLDWWHRNSIPAQPPMGVLWWEPSVWRHEAFPCVSLVGAVCLSGTMRPFHGSSPPSSKHQTRHWVAMDTCGAWWYGIKV
jgi:hypothetical protein